MPTRNVHLTPHLDQVIEASIASGRFSNASEVVREALRLLQQREAEDKARIEWLRSETDEAFASLDRGEGLKFESMDDLTAYIDQVFEEVVSESKRE